LIAVLQSAKVIVTFNGSIFDLNFLRKTFPGIYMPSVHIDLRFFVRRVGLSGGQKKIEPEIGFKRPESVKEMSGESAPILWYKYRRGDKEALKQLISYNHADIEGMKWILDHSIGQLYDREEIPEKIRSNTKFSNLRSKIRWVESKPKDDTPYKVYLSEDVGSPRPLITFEELDNIVSLSDLTTVGIDLVSSEERESGYCILKGNHATTSRVKTDAEMIQQAIDAGANLVSIDSPLSIPKGRTSFFDDDPFREQFGIMRECERILKKRGINVYPCLIPSMQKLTRRGIGLAEKFRKLGIPVIESYPGAAQDILAIPRKRSGLEYLADALLEFGIFDNFTKRKISHDELDAITSAIVGIFFWVGKFEALGNEDEEYLIVPETNRNPSLWIDRKVVGLSGSIAAGKTTAAYFLRDQGFDYGRFSLVLEKILRERDIQPSRRELQDFGNEINMRQKQRWLAKKLVQEMPSHGNLVIDGLRHPEDHAFLAEAFGPAFLHIHISSPETIRLSRYISEGKTKKEFLEASNHPVESNVSIMASLAHVILENTRDIKNLKKRTLEIADVNKQT
jgi:predicted nuclease with RNAse H fold/dephospho-CoA kinase